jgi:hypothetical protein
MMASSKNGPISFRDRAFSMYKAGGDLLFEQFPSSFLILLPGYHNAMNLEPV